VGGLVAAVFEKTKCIINDSAVGISSSGPSIAFAEIGTPFALIVTDKMTSPTILLDRAVLGYGGGGGIRFNFTFGFEISQGVLIMLLLGDFGVCWFGVLHAIVPTVNRIIVANFTSAPDAA
jgi:hypothetical protein